MASPDPSPEQPSIAEGNQPERTQRTQRKEPRFELRKFAWSQEAARRTSKPSFLFSALSALLSVQIVANRDDFRSAEFIPPERELRQHALDNSPTLFVDQPSCGLKSALLWLRLRRAVSSAVDFKSRFSVQPLEGA